MAWEQTNRSENCIHARVTFGEHVCPWELLENFVQGTAGQMHLCGFIFQTLLFKQLNCFCYVGFVSMIVGLYPGTFIPSLFLRWIFFPRMS